MTSLYSFSFSAANALPPLQSLRLPQHSKGPLHPPAQLVAQHLPLEHVVRPMLTTAEAAFYLNLKPQTLRIWACKECGPLRPVRLHGRLGWPVAEIRQYLQMENTLPARAPAH